MLIKREHGFLQRFYLVEIFVGMYITMKNWFFGKNITYQYPEQRRQYSPRYRGQHYIKSVNNVDPEEKYDEGVVRSDEAELG